MNDKHNKCFAYVVSNPYNHPAVNTSPLVFTPSGLTHLPHIAQPQIRVRNFGPNLIPVYGY